MLFWLDASLFPAKCTDSVAVAQARYSPKRTGDATAIASGASRCFIHATDGMPTDTGMAPGLESQDSANGVEVAQGGVAQGDHRLAYAL